MNQWKFTLFIFILAACAACSKDKEIIEDKNDVRIGIASVDEKSLFTNWETIPSWNTSDSSNYMIYFHDRSISEITPHLISTGAVLVYARNIRSDEGGRITKPQQLPLAVIKQTGKMAYDNYWYAITSAGNVKVKFRTNKSVYTQEPAPLPDASTQLRYFIFSKNDLDQMGQTPVSISRLTYDDLVALAGIIP